MHLKIVSYYKQVQANLFDLMCTKMKTSNYLIVRLSMIFPTLSSMLLAFLIDLKSPSLLALRVNASKMSCHEGSLVAILFLGTTLPEIPQVTQMWLNVDPTQNMRHNFFLFYNSWFFIYGTIG